MRPSRTARWSGATLAAGIAAALLSVHAPWAEAQLAPVTFPDTPVGTTSTVKCPTDSVSLCFGTNCNASGTVQSVSGPDRPFKVTKLNLLSLSQFNTGACEANPTGLGLQRQALPVAASEAGPVSDASSAAGATRP